MDALKAEASHQIGWPRSVLVAELQMLESAIRFSAEPGFDNVRVFSDTLLAVQAVARQQDHFDSNGVLIPEIRLLLKSSCFRAVFHMLRTANRVADRKRGVMNPRWGYFRIITGTLLGGVLGFYCMHRAELKYKEMWERRLKMYEEEMNARKNEEAKPNEELL
ncbi:hypothetical protein ACS0TY_035165 [Phlomoides rotata]